jgi:hypothetical protein
MESNFEVPTNIILFEDVTCTVNGDNTEWLCQCCLQGECENPGHHNGGGDKDGTTTTVGKCPIF